MTNLPLPTASPRPDTAGDPPGRFPQTRTAQLARARLGRYLDGFSTPEDLWWNVQDRVPEAWATLEEDVDVEETKTKLTLRIDESVAKFYRAMGKGHQARMNRVLATYAQMQIGGVAREKQEYRKVLAEYGTPMRPATAELNRAWLAETEDPQERFQLETELEMGREI